MPYEYFWIRKLQTFWRIGVGVSLCTVVLISATTGGSSHAAVWMGVSTRDAQTWLQAGIKKSSGSHVSEYIETGRHGQQTSIRTWPTEFGHKAHIRLEHKGNLWRISIDNHRSRWTWIVSGRTSTLALLEIDHDNGIVRGVAKIDGHRISSH